ncbi:peroxisomal biogenesis factor 6 [Dendrobium catenatum]|uniref:Katanin p60 ATPase-containing subunit A1 n=1 Tax=Dendrobium catenatum TaxID=906689 RepID=A0A2I0WEC7_9ASPA|nr:peroxisomal biogenesis factor 6 [Dendrobium catenatum]PKU74011.1 Katanin p60 ATPase-containing subunit A1 [Dendrobium catenatum]
MEPKRMLMSALGVGLGVGVGLGLAGSQTLGKWAAPVQAAGVTADMIGEELMSLVTDGKESKVTFNEFPYYLSEQTRVVLTSAAFVHLKQAEFSKFTRNLSPASRAILLSGPTELYQQMLAKALAHYFESNLLLLDVSDFALKVQSKYGFANKNSAFRRSISESTLERLTSIIGSFSILPQEEPKGSFSGSLHRQTGGLDLRSRGLESCGSISKLRRNASASADIGSLSSESTCMNQALPVPPKRTGNWTFDEKLLIQALHKVLVSVSKDNPIVLYIRDVEGLVFRSQRIHSMFQKMLKMLTGPVLILGSRIVESDTNYGEVDERLGILFPYNIEIKPPQDESHLVSWKSQLEEDMKMMQSQDNKNHILEVLASNDLDCNDLGSICLTDAMVIGNYIEEIVVSAVSYHLMHNKDLEYRNGKLVISSKSLSHVLSIFQENKLGDKDSLKLETNTDATKEDNSESENTKKPETKFEGTSENKSESEKSGVAAKNDGGLLPKAIEFPPDNEFEKRIRSEVIPASEIEVTFDDIGALDDIKESLHELVMLPLRRPDLFKGGLLKPCRGILLFGPPGTGKTMLAKAIANEAGASFINVSMSTLTSKWFGEDEKNVRALFTLAAKVSPTIIFVDEVDSMLGQRSRAGEHEAMRKIKNEFMAHWDGLLTEAGERILVLGATNRPFDLDEAIVRRFERRIMVGLPSVESRELILKSLLSKEKVEDGLEYKELAVMTEGYSGSDLKNLCMTAAYRPLRELIKQERQRELERKQQAEGTDTPSEASEKEENHGASPIVLRPLNMEDMRQAKNQVAPSFSAEGPIMSELRQWNDLYGEGGSRKKKQLTYFL